MSRCMESAYRTVIAVAVLGSGLLNCSSPEQTGEKSVSTGKSSAPLRSTGPLRDFNKDGNADLLWLNQSTGELDAYFLFEPVKIGGSPILDQVTRQLVPVGSGWVVDGSADIDLDGSTDILISNTTTRESQAWFMSGTDRKSFHSINDQSPSGPLATLAPNELIGALGDFDKNGTTDFITYIPGVSASVWFMSGTDRKSVVAIPKGALPNPFNADWKLVSAADIDVDGNIDLVWHNQVTGGVEADFMYIDSLTGTIARSGYNVIARSGGTALSLNAPWSVVGTADINQDGYADLIAHHATTGVTYFFYMTGTDYFDTHLLVDGLGGPADVTVSPHVPTAD